MRRVAALTSIRLLAAMACLSGQAAVAAAETPSVGTTVAAAETPPVGTTVAAAETPSDQTTVAAAETPPGHANHTAPAHASSPSPSPAYPAAAVLAAVRGACADLTSASTAEARAAREGWTQARDPFATPIGPLVRMGYEAVSKAAGGSIAVRNPPSVFSRAVAGEDLYLVVSAVQVEAVSVVGCRVYDPGESRVLDLASAERLVGRAASRKSRQPVMVQYEWQPGLAPGQDSFAYFAIPDTSPLKPKMKFSGVAFKADQIGTVQR